jgi:hypothetical protein
MMRRLLAAVVMIAAAAAFAALVGLPTAAALDQPWLRVSGVILMVLGGLLGLTSGGYLDRANSVDRVTVILTRGAFWRRGALGVGDFTELGLWLFVGVPMLVLGSLAYSAG